MAGTVVLLSWKKALSRLAVSEAGYLRVSALTAGLRTLCSGVERNSLSQYSGARLAPAQQRLAPLCECLLKRSLHSLPAGEHSGAPRCLSQAAKGIWSSRRPFHRCSTRAEKEKLDVFDSQDNRFEKENIVTIPNLLSLGRMVLAPVLAYLVLSESYALAFGGFALAGVSDLVDGYIARTFKNQSSMLGSVLDPLADKLLVSVLYISLTVVSLIPWPLTVVVLGRDALLVSGSFYLRYITLPLPRTWSRYWDIQRSTLQVTPSILGKVSTLLQLSLVGLTLGAPLVDMVGHPVLQALWYVTGFTTVVSGANYMISLGGFKVLKRRSLLSKKNDDPT